MIMNENASYEINKVYEAMKKEIAEKEKSLAGWQAVTFPTKKDGTPFSAMSKNISGAKYKLDSAPIRAGEYILTIDEWSARPAWDDCIHCYTSVDSLDDTRRAKTENYLPKESFWTDQRYLFDLDDIKQAVKEKIERLEADINDLKDQLKKVSDACGTYYDICRAAQEILLNMTGCENSLYWNIRHIVDQRITLY